MREDRKAEFQRAIEENQRRLAELNDASDSNNENRGDAADQGSEEEWGGFAEPPAVDYEAEYIDENKYTTVTVEDMDPSKEGLYKATQGDDGSENEQREQEEGKAPASEATKPVKKKPWNKNDRDPANKKKKKKFRYESPAERKAGRLKERMSNRKQAKARKAT